MRYTKIVAVASLALASSLSFSSCTKWEGETVESAYMLPMLPDPNYSFSRNGSSSVDYRECDLLKEPIDFIYKYRLEKAGMMYAHNIEDTQSYFNNGLYGIKPREEIATSSLHSSQHSTLVEEVENIFSTTATLSGYSASSPTDPDARRNKRASLGSGGFVGRTVADDYVFFVNDKGLAVSEVFTGIIQGAIYLDKILNVHLDDKLFASEELRSKHELLSLVKGQNYTELEHHWDLAYGYYQYWLPYVQSEGLPILRDSRIKIYNAFAIGRKALTEFRYDEMMAQIPIIRQELSKVVAVRAMNLLVGETTLVNLDEEASNGFRFISQGIGMLYALPFTLRADGKPYLSWTEVNALRDELLSGSGLWEQQRLLSSEETTGSLRHVAAQIGKPYGLTLDSIKKSSFR